MADGYRRFWLTSTDAVEREILLAEAFEAGAAGAEETEGEGRFRACIYAKPDRIESIRKRLHERSARSTKIEPSQALPDVDWSQAWQAGLEAVRISPRLVVRPPFVEWPLEPGQREIVIDPGQAFGTGGHASTRLCLEWIDVLLGEVAPIRAIDRILDVGTGSGVLALAALKLGVRQAVAFDLDPVAIAAASDAARDNGLEERVCFFVGPLAALGGPQARFPLVVANLLKSEMLPIASGLAERVSRSGCLILAGLLEEDVASVCARFEGEGMREVARRRRDDSTGGWVGLQLAFDPREPAV